MSNGKLTAGTLTPAYGRDYTSGPLARADFENGKDFILHAYGESRTGPVGRSDFANGSRVTIRYGKLRKVCTHIVGQAPMPPAPRKPRKLKVSMPGRYAGAIAKAKRATILDPLPPVAQSWRVDVYADDSGKACGNGLRFATALEAENYGRQLQMAWTLVRSFVVLESGDVATHYLENGQVRSL